MRTQKPYEVLIGKSGPSGSHLPVWVHMHDTSEICHFVFESWCSEHGKGLIIKNTGCTLDELERTILLLGYLHDIGKMTPVFQKKIVMTLPERIALLNQYGFYTDGCYQDADMSPHGIAAEAFLLSQGAPAGFASIIGAHHGKPRKKDPAHRFSGKGGHIDSYAANFYGEEPEYLQDKDNSPWHIARCEYLKDALYMTGFTSLSQLPNFDRVSQVIILGLLTTADWISSNTYYFPLFDADDTGETVNFKARTRIALKKLDFPTRWVSTKRTYSNQIFKDTFGFDPNMVQEEIIRIVNGLEHPGMLVLESPMGWGKTEAALAAASVFAARSGCSGLLFCLPTQATANGIFGRLADWGKSESEGMQLSIRLAHGMAELNEEYRSLFEGEANVDGEEGETSGFVVHQYFKGPLQALLASLTVSTIDQALMVALKKKHFAMRHFGIAGKVVVIDEVHAYDEYMRVYLKAFLNWCGKYDVPVILLSATLPASTRAELFDAYQNIKSRKEKKARENAPWRTGRGYPLITYNDGKDVCQKVVETNTREKRVRIEHLKKDEMPSYLASRLGDGCAGVILNTVKKAQEASLLIKAAIPDAHVIVLHSQFIAEDRARIEKDVLSMVGKRSDRSVRKRTVVIGTQVLEQSLDIDFDLLITDLCPMDLLLQRIGRLHRHPRADRPDELRTPVCAVIGAGEEDLDKGSSIVYGEWLLMRTKELLPKSVRIPGDIQDLVQDTYMAPTKALSAQEQAAYNDYIGKIESKSASASVYCLTPPESSPRKADELTGLLDTAVTADETRAERSVRDATFSAQVLVMMRDREGTVRFLPWSHDGQEVARDRIPSDEDARAIMMQRVSLPLAITAGRGGDEVIDYLEQLNARELPEWQLSHWIRGELVLLLDNDLHIDVPGYHIFYTKEKGLSYAKAEIHTSR